MKKRQVTKKDLNELALIMPVISEKSEQRGYVGGIGTSIWNSSPDNQDTVWTNTGSGFMNDSGYEISNGTTGDYGSGQSSFNSGNFIEDKLITDIRSALAARGFNLSQYSIEYGEGRGCNAAVIDGKIIIYQSALKYGFGDLCAIISHEYDHLTSCYTSLNSTSVAISEVTLEVPERFKAFVWKISGAADVETDRPNAADFYNKRETTLKSILNPSYYEGEICAIQKEMNDFPNVSTEYALEREYMLWLSQQKLILAQQYYEAP